MVEGGVAIAVRLIRVHPVISVGQQLPHDRDGALSRRDVEGVHPPDVQGGAWIERSVAARTALAQDRQGRGLPPVVVVGGRRRRRRRRGRRDEGGEEEVGRRRAAREGIEGGGCERLGQTLELTVGPGEHGGWDGMGWDGIYRFGGNRDYYYEHTLERYSSPRSASPPKTYIRQVTLRVSYIITLGTILYELVKGCCVFFL